MTLNYLNRNDTPFAPPVWSALDEAVIGVARGQLSGRKLLEIEGPYGLGLRTLSLRERTVTENPETGSWMMASVPWPLAFFHAEFRMPVRELVAFEETGLSLNLRPARDAAFEIARMEDSLIFTGSKEIGVDGLLTAPGSKSVAVSGWENVGAAADIIIGAITQLDKAGFHGPYILALSPGLYNLLLRRYPTGEVTELEHIGVMVTHGIHKAPFIGSGGVLLASGGQYASIVLGQDIMVGFIGPEGSDSVFSVSESMFLKINAPESICVLTV